MFYCCLRLPIHACMRGLAQPHFEIPAECADTLPAPATAVDTLGKFVDYVVRFKGWVVAK